MKLITFKGSEFNISQEQAEKIIASGKTNLIAINIDGRKEYINANDIAAILSGGEQRSPDAPKLTEPVDEEKHKRQREMMSELKAKWGTKNEAD